MDTPLLKHDRTLTEPCIATLDKLGFVVTRHAPCIYDCATYMSAQLECEVLVRTKEPMFSWAAPPGQCVRMPLVAVTLSDFSGKWVTMFQESFAVEFVRYLDQRGVGVEALLRRRKLLLLLDEHAL